MKAKNVNFVDKYLEFVVLGAAAIFFLAVLWFYVLSSPYKVTVGDSRQPVAPEQVEDLVRTEAEKLDEMINTPLPADHPLAAFEVPDYTENFESRARKLLARGDLPVPFSLPGLDEKVGDFGGGGPTGVYDIASVGVPKPPQDVVARANNYVLLPDEQLQNELLDQVYAEVYYELEAELPPTQQVDENKALQIAQQRVQDRVSQWHQITADAEPRDFQAASVMAQWDVQSWIDAFKQAQTGVSSIPPEWWQNRLFVTAVELHRQVQDPQTGQFGVYRDGQFVPSTQDDPQYEVIQPLPGQITFLDEPQTWERDEASIAWKVIRHNQEAITKPSFLLSHPQWLPPNVQRAKLSAQDIQRINEIRTQLQDIDKKISRLEPRDQQQGRPQPGAPRPGVTDLPPEYEDFERGGRTAPRRTQPSRQTQPDRTSNAQSRREELRSQQLNELYEQRATLEAELVQIESQAAEAPADPNAVDPQYPDRQFQNPDATQRNPRDPGFDTRIYEEGGYVDPERLPGERPGVRPGVRPTPPTTRNVPRPPGNRPQVPQAEQETKQELITVWGHDLTVETGKTYRYRVAVRMMNPLWQQAGLSPEQAEEHKDKLSIAGEPSAWSEPITIEKQTHQFLADVSPRNKQATFEVWFIFNGNWEKRQFTVNPGDPIGGTVEVQYEGKMHQIDLSTGGVLVDVVESESDGTGLSRRQVRVLVSDSEGQLADLDVEGQKSDPTRQRLEYEMEQRKIARTTSGTVGQR